MVEGSAIIVVAVLAVVEVDFNVQTQSDEDMVEKRRTSQS
jgi:hypothetical protein